MKSALSGILFTLIAWFPAPANAQAIQLQYELVPGETYTMDLEIQQSTRSESMEGDEISLSSHSLLIFRLDSIVDSGELHLTVRYRELQLAMIAPGMDITFNSRDRNNPALTTMLDSLESGSFHIIIDRRGDLKGVGGLDAIFDGLSYLPLKDSTEHRVALRTLEELYGPDSFRSLAGLFLSVYPVLPAMTNWTNDIIYFFNTKPVQMVNRYNLARITESYCVIQGMGMLNSSEAFVEDTGMGRVESTVSGSQTYDFQMDRRSGWINRCVSRQRLMIQTTILESPSLPAGLKIPSYTETVFEVTGSGEINN